MIQTTNLRVVFMGTRGEFSLAVLAALLEAGVNVCAVVVPSVKPSVPTAIDIVERAAPLSHSALPIVNPFLTQDITTIAWQQGIPVFEVRKLGTAHTLATIAALRADVGCVACFPRRLPQPLLDRVRHGWINVHPSILPAYRGPAPVFWIMRHGNQAAGVTLHLMDNNFDTGDIVAQARVQLPDGMDGRTIDAIIGQRGGALLVDVLADAQQNTLTRQPQPVSGTAAPWPTATDFAIGRDWSARRAYNFMRATTEWYQPYPIGIDGTTLSLATALDYKLDQQINAPYLVSGRVVRIRFDQDVLDALIA